MLCSLPWRREMRVETRGPLAAVVRAPGSKSLTQRAILIAALARGESRIGGALLCEDTQYLVRALRELGVRIEEKAGELLVQGNGGELENPGRELFLGNNGTALRFLTTVLCMGLGQYKLTGTPRLCERPMGPLLDALGELGGRVESRGAEGCAPIWVNGTGGLRGGRVRLDGSSSSQFASSLLICAPLMNQGLELFLQGAIVSVPYLSLTAQTMRRFGVEVVQRSRRRFLVRGAQSYSATSLEIEGDLSSASYFLAAAAICGGWVRVEGINGETLQGDVRICRILEQIGSRVTFGPNWIRVDGGPLRDGDLELDLGDAPDLVPTVAAISAVRPGRTRIAKVSHLRLKESDRLRVLKRELGKLGARVWELPDGLMLEGGGLHGGLVDPQDDHRIAMSLAVVGLRVPGVVIGNPGCVAKSYPDFWEDLRRVKGT